LRDAQVAPAAVRVVIGAITRVVVALVADIFPE
jgi:hypothetical protein